MLNIDYAYKYASMCKYNTKPKIDNTPINNIGDKAVSNKIAIIDVRILIEVINTVGIEQWGAAFNAMYNVVFLQQKLCQIGSILPGNSGDQCNFTHKIAFSIINLTWKDDIYILQLKIPG